MLQANDIWKGDGSCNGSILTNQFESTATSRKSADQSDADELLADVLFNHVQSDTVPSTPPMIDVMCEHRNSIFEFEAADSEFATETFLEGMQEPVALQPDLMREPNYATSVGSVIESPTSSNSEKIITQKSKVVTGENNLAADAGIAIGCDATTSVGNDVSTVNSVFASTATIDDKTGNLMPSINFKQKKTVEADAESSYFEIAPNKDSNLTKLNVNQLVSSPSSVEEESASVISTASSDDIKQNKYLTLNEDDS